MNDHIPPGETKPDLFTRREFIANFGSSIFNADDPTLEDIKSQEGH